jgi:hypothetical protein
VQGRRPNDDNQRSGHLLMDCLSARKMSHAETTHPELSVTLAFALARRSAATTRSKAPAAAKCSGVQPRSSRAFTLESASKASTKGRLPDQEMSVSQRGEREGARHGRTHVTFGCGPVQRRAPTLVASPDVGTNMQREIVRQHNSWGGGWRELTCNNKLRTGRLE